MASLRKKHRLLFGVSAGITSVLILQTVWLHYAYMQTRQQLMVHVKEAFEQAYGKEQTYRIPVVDIVNPGAVTIESCGTEEILIIRKCPEPDTIAYNNPSGLSIESFISRVFVDLREHITPMNINCLADLFAGMLHEKDIPAYFVVERVDAATGEILDTSLLPDKKQPAMNPETTLTLEISEKEFLRAIMHITPGVVLAQIMWTFIFTICFSIIAIACICYVYRRMRNDNAVIQSQHIVKEQEAAEFQKEPFAIGQYTFDAGKNELRCCEESIQLNKKENAILYALCVNCGNVVERTLLLDENWGSNGFVYSRSLDTYITSLRKYFRKDPSVQIVTIKGLGYKLVC